MSVSAASLARVKLKVIPTVSAEKATQAEAEAGLNTSKYMTPATTKQQIDARVASDAEAIAGTAGRLIQAPEFKANAELVNYTPLGGVTRTIRSALREFSFASDRGAFTSDAAANTAKLQAVMADNPEGARIIMPPGTTRFAQMTVPSFMKLEGDGSGTTNLIFSHPTGDTFSLGADVCVAGILVAYDVPRTAGRTFFWTENGTGLEDVQIYDYFIAVETGDISSGFTVDPYMRRCRLNDGVVAAGTAGAVFNNYSNGIISDLIISGTESGLQQDRGLFLRRGDTFFIEKVNATRTGAALLLDPAGAHSCLSVNVVGCYFDSAGQVTGGAQKNSVEIIPSGGGHVKDILFTNTWFGLSSGAGGCLLSPVSGLVDGVSFNGCQFIDNNVDGLAMSGANVKNVVVNGGWSAGNVRYGQHALAGASDFTITGHRAGDVGGRGPNSYGVVVAAGSASDGYLIANNNLLGNTISGLFDGGTGVNKLVANNLI